jgi:putative oxidoreductase
MRSNLAAYAPLVARLMLGVGFLYHGLPKWSPGGHQRLGGMLQSLGIPTPAAMSWVVSVVEVGGAVAMLAGAFVGLAGVLLLVDMLVAMFKVHFANGFNFIHIVGMSQAGPTFGMPGYEVNLLYIALILVVVLAGAGRWSADEWRRLRSTNRSG